MAWKKSKYKELGPNWQDYRREYQVWRMMLWRCFDKKCKKYPHYGGRGITVCKRWSDKDTGFINFYKDMGQAPKDSNGKPYQLDRIDNNGNYCPENCKWVTRRENMRNRRDNIYIHIYGEKMCAADACSLFHLNRTTVTERIRLFKEDPDTAIIGVLQRKGIALSPVKKGIL